MTKKLTLRQQAERIEQLEALLETTRDIADTEQSVLTAVVTRLEDELDKADTQIVFFQQTIERLTTF